MKKVLTTILLIALLVSNNIFSASQKLYSYDSWEYQTTKYLCQIAGVSAPHPVTPVTEAYLSDKINSIPQEKLPSELKSILNELKKKVEEPTTLISGDSFYFDPQILISPEAYIRVGSTARKIDAFDQYKDHNPIIDLRLEASWSDNIYGLISFPVAIKATTNDLEAFGQNIFIPGSTEPYQRMTPFETGISIGNDVFSLFLGRNDLNIGYGYTGNLFVADNFTYQDYAKFSIYNKYLSYDFTYTHFDQDIINSDKTSSIEKKDKQQSLPWPSFDPPHQIRLTHTFTLHLFEKLEFSFNDGIIVQSESAFDLRMFNPFIYMHNWNGFEDFWANSFYGINLSSNIASGWRINFELIMDQFQLKTETNPYPNAFGALLNVSNVYPLRKGFLETYIEGVYTNPYLYLNDLREKSEEDKTPHQDLILGYFLSYDSELSYTGYKYGPDSAVIAVGSKFTEYFNKWNIEGMLMYKAHGQHGIKYAGTNQDPYASLEPEDRLRFCLTGIIEHTLSASIKGELNIIESLSLYTDLTYQYRWNYNNETDRTFSNLAWTIGFTFSPMEFFK